MTLDELLLEWSYKSERGYPSLDNPSDILILQQILSKLDIPSEDIIKQLNEQEDQETPVSTTGGSESYDAVIRRHLDLSDDQPIPKSKNNYPFPSHDRALYLLLFLLLLVGLIPKNLSNISCHHL